MTGPTGGPAGRADGAQDPEDEVLIRRAGSGDEDAFEILFDRYAGALRAWIGQSLSGRLRRKVSVADVLQEARITALARCLDFEDRGRGSARAWLFKIVEHKIRDAVRRYAGTAKRGAVREVTRGERPDTARFAAEGPSPSEVAGAGELGERLREALLALPEDYREVLRLARLEELPLREVAARMGRSREAVKKLYGRALSRFTEVYMAAEGDGDA
jgi:RNA polymerase sigma-70 factor (ECF subfamily)